MTKRPVWWDWELELHPHLYKRMAERDFTEVDVRSMLQATTRLRRDVSLAAGSRSLASDESPGKSSSSQIGPSND